MSSSLRRHGTLLSNEHFEIVDEGRVVHAKRTARGFDSIDEVRAAHTEVVALFDRVGRRGRRLMLDLRLAPGRMDPEFERAMKGFRPRIVGGWDRCAVLVKSALGGLQVRRLGREDGVAERLAVFDDPTLTRAHVEAHEPLER